MKDLYDLITNHPSLEQILVVLLLPLLGWSLGKIYDRYKGDSIFSNKRIIYRLLVCSLLGLISVTFHCHVFAWLIFSTMIVLSAFLPFPHEYFILRFGKANKRSKWLVTTPALLKFYWKLIKHTSDQLERQDVKLQFLNEIRLRKWELFDYEYRKYYIEILKVYYDIGAVSLLKENLDRLQRFSDDKIYIQLLMLYYEKSCMYKGMGNAFKKLTEITTDTNELSVEKHIDEMAVAEKLGEPEKEAKAVKTLEADYKKLGVTIPILCSNLMQYYDRVGEHDKAEKLAQEIIDFKPKSFDSYLELRDIAFMHYRRTNNFERMSHMLDDIWTANEKMQDGEKKMLTQVKLMHVFFNNQGRWMQYSAVVFNHHNDYLNKSWRVGTELIKQTERLCLEAQNLYHLQLSGEGAKKLYDDFDLHVDEYLKAIDEEIALTKEEYVYRYIDLLMDKLELITYKFRNKNLSTLAEEKNRIYERILNRTKVYGAKRDYLHFLTVYIDDILTCHQQIEDFYAQSPSESERIDYDRYEKSWDIYRDNAIEGLTKMDCILSDKENYISLAYYILYASYFHHLMNDQTKALYYFKKFEATGVSIKNFSLAVEKIYTDLKIKVADEPVRWESPNGEFGYINIKVPKAQ